MYQPYTYRMPAYWASALINGDASGTTDAELSEIEQATAAITAEIGHAHCSGMENESEFESGYAADFGGNLAGAFADFIFLVEVKQ